MIRTNRKFLAVASAASLGFTVLAGCSGSSAPPPGSAALRGKPLIIVDDVGKTFTRTFNPYDQTSFSAAMNMQDLTYEPLLMFNMMNPAQALVAQCWWCRYMSGEWPWPRRWALGGALRAGSE